MKNDSLIYRLTEEQSEAINRVGVLVVESDSCIDIYDMSMPKEIASNIEKYFADYNCDNIYVCGGEKDAESLDFKEMSISENHKYYIFFMVKCDCDTDVIISLKDDFVTRTWLNGRFIISRSTPFITKINAGDNLFIFESASLCKESYMHCRINALKNECNKQPLSYITGNLQNFTGRFWWMNKEYDSYSKGKVEYILLPLDEVNVDVNQKLEAHIYLYEPFMLLDSFDNYFYQPHVIDLSKYDYPVSDSPNHLIFQAICHSKDGKESIIERKFFLYPVVDKSKHWVEAAKRLMESGKISLEEYNCLGFYIQAVLQPDVGLLEGRDDSVSMLADAIKAVESGEYIRELYAPGHKYFYTHSPLDGRFQRVGVHLPDGYNKNQKYPLLLFMMTGSWRNFEKSSVMDCYHKEAVISVDVSGRGVTLGSYVGEASFFDILSEIKRLLSVDDRRVYMIGYSGGGFAAFSLAQAAPHLFAGICPSGADLYLPDIKNLYNLKVINIVSKADLSYSSDTSLKLAELPDYTEITGDKTSNSYIAVVSLNLYGGCACRL